MKNLLISLLLALSLTACDRLSMERKAVVHTSTITWIDAKPTHCGVLGDETNIEGCATWDNSHSTCTITMPADSTDWIVAHEFKHCFGWMHPNGRL